MITLAKDGMQTDLERIWRLCFDRSPQRMRYFFDNRYNPNRCAVYIDEAVGHPVAMLHMLEANITEDSEIVPVQYIYAMATRPDYRGRGIMRQLVEYAKRCAALNGERYQIVVPGSREMFRWFEDRGFYRCFRVRSVFMSRKDLTAISDVKRNPTAKGISGLTLSLNDINAVRRDLLVDREGFVTWDYQAIKYAIGLHEYCGGAVVTATNGFEAGYALCTPRGSGQPENAGQPSNGGQSSNGGGQSSNGGIQSGQVFISEFVCHQDFEARVIRNILRMYPQDSFEFRLPVYPEFFSRFGQTVDFGMIYAINGRKPINILTLSGTHTPYLGLTLEQ